MIKIRKSLSANKLRSKKKKFKKKKKEKKAALEKARFTF